MSNHARLSDQSSRSSSRHWDMMHLKRGRPRKSTNGAEHRAAPKKVRRGKVKAKYRDPKTKDTWSGRGRMASWLKSKVDAGEKVEKYLV